MEAMDFLIKEDDPPRLCAKHHKSCYLDFVPWAQDGILLEAEGHNITRGMDIH